MALKLKGSTSGFVALDSPAVAGNNTITLPDSNGSANQVWANDNTAGVTTYTQVTINRNGDIVTPGTLSIGGTITYEDVTNVDSVGIITARTDIHLGDKLVHYGDTNTAIRFPAADTVSVETAGQQNVKVNGTRVALTSPSGTDTTVRLQHQGNSGYGDIILDRTVNAFIISNDPSNASNNQSYFSVKNKGTTNLHIKYDGKIGIATDNPAYQLDCIGDNGASFAASTDSSNGVLSVVGRNSAGSVSAISRVKSYPDGSSNQSHMAFETRNSSASMVEAMRITSAQKVIVGHTVSVGKESTLQSVGNGGDLLDLSRYVANEYGPNLHFIKSRNDTSGSHTIVQANDDLGIINFRGSDGSAYRSAAEIKAEVDGTPGSSDMPGRLVLSTTADGGTSCTGRMTISASGQLRLGTDHHSDRTSHNVQCSNTGAKVLSLNHATNVGGSDIDLGFYARNSNNATVEFGRISVDATTTTANSSQKGYMAFFVNNSATMVERFRITSTGALNIGTNGSSLAENNVRFQSSGTGYIDHATTGQSIQFRMSDSSSLDTTAMSISDEGVISIPAVTNSRALTLNPGSGAGSLVFDRNGHITSNIRAGDAGSNTGGGSGGGSRITLNKNYLQFSTFPYVTNVGDAVTYTEKMRIGASNTLWGTSTVLAGDFDTIRINNGSSYVGTCIRSSGGGGNSQNNEYCWLFHRMGTDGKLVAFNHAGTEEGNISVSGSTVSYNGGHLSRWSQLVGISTNVKSDRPTIYQGTVMSNLDEMCEWTGEENQQLNKTKVSTASGDKNVAGVFWAWDDDDDEYTNDFYIAMTGDMVIRVAASTTVARGDLLESAGDGTAKPQSDDIVRSKTIAKITSTTSTATYADGSKAYPCVLMAC